MQVDSFKGRRRRAVAGIIAAVILFAMLFTVGTGYFLFVNSTNKLYVSALASRSSAQQNQLSEGLLLTTLKLNDGNIGIYANNTGGIGVNVTSLYLLYSGKRATPCMGIGLPSGCSTPSTSTFPSCQFPVYVNIAGGTKGIPIKLASGCTTVPGQTSGCTSNTGSLSSCIDTGQPANSTNAAIRLVTQRGTVFSAAYPQSSVSLAAQALSSGAIGDLYIAFHTFNWYKVNYCAGSSPPYCLSNQGLGFSVSCSTLNGGNIAFSLTMTDLNSQKLNITLDQYTLLNSFIPPKATGGGSNPTLAYYIISNVTNVISTQYTQITLSYNQPKTVVFASGNPDGNSAFSPQGSNFCLAPPQITFSFTVTHGCQGISHSKCSIASYENYGQVAPYVSSLYY